MKRLAGMAAFGMLLAAQTTVAEQDFHCPPGTVVPAAVEGNVIVHAGGFCSGVGSTIKGNVVLLPDAVGFELHGGLVEGSVQSERLQREVRVVSATVRGSIHIKGMRPSAAAAIFRNNILGDVIFEENAGTTTVGEGVPADGCPGEERNLIHGSIKLLKNSSEQALVCNRVFGNLQGEENSGALRVERNSVGQNVQLYKNTGITTVILNSVGANLQCYENAVIAGTGNVARGNKEGQCSTF
jgi:hypothetical protein